MKKYIIITIIIIFAIVGFLDLKGNNRTKNNFNPLYLDGEKSNLIYDQNRYYLLKNKEFIEVKNENEADIAINNRIRRGNNEKYELIFTYEWLKKSDIKSYIVAITFDNENVINDSTRAIRERYVRNTIDSEWNLVDKKENVMHTQSSYGYIWSNFVNEKSFTNKRDVFKIIINNNKIDNFNFEFACSYKKDIVLKFEENNGKIIYENREDIFNIKL